MHRFVQAFTIGLLLNSGKAVAQNNQIMLLEKKWTLLLKRALAQMGLDVL